MSNNRLSVHVPDGLASRLDEHTDEEDVQSDVLRDALKKGLDEMEREQNYVSHAMVLCAIVLAVAGASVAALGFVTKLAAILMAATLLLAGAVGLLAFELLFYRT